MEKLKLRNSQLEKENAMLKSELIRMASFSKRMVEITAEMDDLLNQRANEIQKLEQDLKLAANVDVTKNADFRENFLCNKMASQRPVHAQCLNAPVSELISPLNTSEEDKTDNEDIDIADFTVALDDIPELIGIKNQGCREGQENKMNVRKRKRNNQHTSNHNYEMDEWGYYKCPHCPRSMKQSSNLRAHVMIHTGEKPWKCKYCDERFTQSGERGLHMRRVHCDILGTVQCNFCKRYFDPKKLNAHIQKSHPKLASKLVAN